MNVAAGRAIAAYIARTSNSYTGFGAAVTGVDTSPRYGRDHC